VPTESNDDANPDATEDDKPTEVIRARADRLDRVGPSQVGRSGDPDLGSEVAALKKQLQGYRRTTVVVVPMIVLLLVVVVVVMFASTPDALPEGSGNGTVTATAPTTTTSVVPSVRQSPPATTTAASTTAVTVTVTGAADTVAKRIPAPKVFLNGQQELASDEVFNFDNGYETNLPEGDVTHDGQALSGTDGAVLAHGVPAEDEYSSCATVPTAGFESHLPFDEFADNPILCIRTDEGRLAYAELTDFPTSNGGDYMSFRWTTWEK
jgi:hypothetical protein